MSDLVEEILSEVNQASSIHMHQDHWGKSKHTGEKASGREGEREGLDGINELQVAGEMVAVR